MTSRSVKAATSLACLALALTGLGCREDASPVDPSNSFVVDPQSQDLRPGSTRNTSFARILRGRLEFPPPQSLRPVVEIRSHRKAPRPIPGGIQIPGGPLIHVFLPGPESIGHQGVDVEPNVITDFKGFVAVAFLHGQAVDRDGTVYDMANDIRVFRGDYIGEDGRRHEGTFGFI